jgi:hypothetical protein
VDWKSVSLCQSVSSASNAIRSNMRAEPESIAPGACGPPSP